VTAPIHRGTNARYSDTATRNIESILRLEKEDQEALSPYHRLSHAIGWFVGTVYFVVFECAMVLGWIAFNVGMAPTHWTFDPYPFPLLAVVLGLEAVLLTSFVLIRQNSIDRTSERRNHLDLQINLLAEEEATKVLKMLGEIAAHLKLPVHDPDNKDLSQHTQVESIARDLRTREKKEAE
jgi:uncharacterized membrane protein